MFSFLKKTIFGGYKNLKKIFGIKNLDGVKEIKDIENIFLENNFGPRLTKEILKDIDSYDENKFIKIKEKLKNILNSANKFIEEENEVYLIIGINGSGKTTSLIKLARNFKKENKKTILVPADKFRAAAQEQLKFLCDVEKIDYFDDFNSKDSATLIYKSIVENKNFNKILIDTAGRIHENEALLKELKKIYKIVNEKALEKNFKVKTLIVLDSLQGQALEKQILQFSENVKIDGIILTKLDSGAKPGNIFSIVDTFKIPIIYLTYGEYKEEIVLFDIDSFIEIIIGD